MKELVSGLLFGVMSVVGAFASESPRWISVMPLNADNIESISEDAIALGNDTFVDGIVWSFALHPEGEPASDKAAIYAERYQKMKKLVSRRSKVRLGMLLQSTMGHGGMPGSPSGFQRVVRPNGSSFYRMCPLDHAFLGYISRACRALAKVEPDFFMVDDDTRLTLGDEAAGCFCPLHLAEFSKRTGRKWTREGLVAALGKDEELNARWDELIVDSLSGLFHTIRSSFAPETPGSICVCSGPSHLKHARHYAELLAAPGQTPTVRGNGAPFHNYGKDLLHIVQMRSVYAGQSAVVGAGALFMQEADTCPHTLWMSSATRLFDHIVMLALDGYKGAKIWITRTGNYHEKRSGLNYRKMFRDNCGMMKWAASVDLRQGGVVIPTCGPVNNNFGDLYLGITGIPYRFGKTRPGEITALTAATLALMTREEIIVALSGCVIADGTAAIWLTANGFSEDIGVNAKPWNRKTIQIHEFADGHRQSGMRVNVHTADLTDMHDATKVMSKLYNRPSMDALPVYEAPGAVRFTNRRGGEVVVLAQPLPTATPISYAQTLLSESYKRWIVGLLSELGGGIPGGVYYVGDGPTTCISGKTEKDEEIVVLNMLDLDGDDAPELRFDSMPSVIERLQGDGSWLVEGFDRIDVSTVILSTKAETQRPVILRIVR